MATATTKGFERSEKTRLGKTAKSIALNGADSAEKLLGKRQENRRERFRLQGVAARLLSVDAAEVIKKNPVKKYVGDVHRTCDCTWSVIGSHVAVMQSQEFKTGHYKNLATCGSVWACPICTAKIQERRRVEIAKAMDRHYQDGGQVIMVTLTAPHYKKQLLKDLRKMQSKALTHLRGAGSYRDFLKDNGYLGLIRSLEVTVSQRNGWHLHTHELWFVDRDADVAEIKRRTLQRWRAACIKQGFLDGANEKKITAFNKHAVDIKANVSTSEYVAKMDDSSHWGADREIAKSSTKKGKRKGLHPFGLLAEIHDKTEKADWAGLRFIEYCRAMKGARQIYWSPGLKDLFEIDEKTDEELATMEESELIHVVDIDIPTWKIIRRNGGRSTIPELVELGDRRALDLYINSQRELSLKPQSG